MILVGLTPPRCFLLNIFTWGFFSESSWHPGGVPRRWWVCSSPFAVLAAVQGFGSNQVPLKSGDIKKMYRDLGYLVTYRQSRGQVCTYEHIYIYMCCEIFGWFCPPTRLKRITVWLPPVALRTSPWGCQSYSTYAYIYIHTAVHILIYIYIHM